MQQQHQNRQYIFDDKNAKVLLHASNDKQQQSNVPHRLLWGWLCHHASTRLLLSPNETTTATTTSAIQNPSVHMQLNAPSQQKATTSETTTPSSTSIAATDQNDNTLPHQTANKTIQVLKYIHTNGTVYQALNTPPDKFQAFLKYLGIHVSPSSNNKHKKENPFQHYQVNATQELRDEWRALWKQERLLTDRTELLAVYPSDQKRNTLNHDNKNSDRITDKSLPKRGGFSDHLYLYTERLLAILRDEHTLHQQAHHSKNEESWLLTWLQQRYERTQQLRQLSIMNNSTEQLAELKRFLEWFRIQFPYYYDRCASCGASYKEDSATQESDPLQASFLGYVHPSFNELSGKASRTELYHCHVCRQFTRFPRYNSARHVVEARQGRCGEYSVLLFAILRALGQEARWVVDWADHVWAEIRLQGRWIHLDPCEAAVDENAIYQEWGKQQTYILAFYAPPRGSVTSNYPLIQDITGEYTTDAWSIIQKRRDESEAMVRHAIREATEKLKEQLTSQAYLVEQV
jgi:hypothetical protein